MGEVKTFPPDLQDILEKSQKIVSNYKDYKKAYQQYEKNPKKLSDDEKKLINEYKDFVNRTIDIINQRGLSDDVVKTFIETKGIAEAIASTITFKPTQLRKIFHQIRTIKQELKGEVSLESFEISLIKILPLLAYSKGRGLISEDFYKLSRALISKVRESLKKEDFEKFVDIFEAIVAYHRYYKPKES